jgi:hypothetical protein
LETGLGIINAQENEIRVFSGEIDNKLAIEE